MNAPRCCDRTGLLLKTVTRLLLFCIVWKIAVCGVEARAQGVSEYDLKAACLAKFPQFVKWPSSSGTMTVGILGDDPFGGALDKMIKVKRGRRVEDLKGCQIVFVAKSERGNLGGIIASLAGANVLIVGESEGFVKQGGMIGFTMEGDKVRFEINPAAAQRAGLEISSQLLKLARRVVSS